MRVQKIKINNFKSIYDELIIDFDDIKGFWKIEGDVGSGKTTIGEAIIFGLFGSITGKTNDSLISWGGKHAVVEIWLTSKGNNIYIRREINAYGQSPMYIEINGDELISTNKRDAQQQLEQEYYDISRNTVELLCIISFNNFKSLATMGSKDTKNFLDHMLGFEVLTHYVDVCKTFQKDSTAIFDTLSHKISANNSQIEKIIELTNQSKIDGDITDTQRHITDIQQAIAAYQRETEQTVAVLTASLHEQQSQLATVKALGSNKKKEIDFIKKGVCPTCGAPIDQSQLAVKEQERTVLLDQYKMLTKEINTAAEEIDSYKQRRQPELTRLNNVLQGECDLLTALKSQEKRALVDSNAIIELRDKNKELAADQHSISSDIQQWCELQSILSDDVRQKILSSFIPALNASILQYSQQLGVQYIITFDTTFKCNITISGADTNIPISSLSTGQLKTVDMCIILGVLNTITSNVSFNILFVDELFSNMDYELRTAMCKTLKVNAPQDQTLFIVSHNELEDKYFDGYIHSKLKYIDSTHKKSVYKISKDLNKE